MSLRTRKDWLRHVLYGMCMGAADLVPGVSGGTMALICGIYERLIHAIKSLGTIDALSIFWFDFRRFKTKVAWDFILALFLGIGFSFILFSQMIHFMLGDPDWRVYLYALFFGMILSSIVFCIRRVPNWNKRLWWWLAFGAAATLFFTGFRAEPLVNGKRYDVAISAEFRYSGPIELVNYEAERGLVKGVSEKELAAMWMKGFIKGSDKVYLKGGEASVLVSDVVKPAEYSWFDPWLVFCGAIAVSAMLLPGISGSFLLMLLGAYPMVIGALADLVKGWTELAWDGEAFAILINLALGIVLGALLFSRMISWFLKKNHDMTMAVLIGFMIGAMRVVWPFWTYAWVIDPLRLAKGPQLLMLAPYSPGYWDPQYWKASWFGIAGFAFVYLLTKLSEGNAKDA